MQRSFDDLGTPLHSVTFCVVDLETTGAAPSADDPRPGAPLPRETVDGLSCVSSWLDAEVHRVRLVRCDGELASPLHAPAAAVLRGPARQG